MVRRLAVALLAAFALAPAAAAAAAPPLRASVLGEPPNGGGVFRFPQAVALSPGGGSVFVGDQLSGRVQAFDNAGRFRFEFGARAARGERGRLGVVGGVATDRDGRVYVLDSENDRVQVFDAADGRPLGAFGDAASIHISPTLGSGINAGGLAVFQAVRGESVSVYVADPGLERVSRFVLPPGSVTPAGPATGSSVPLSNPQGLTTDPRGTRLYVADDDNHRVVVLDPVTLAFVAAVGSFGTGPGQFQNPYDVAVDAGSPSRLYVGDNLNNRVDVFDAASLASLGTYGGFGRRIGGFSIVRAVGALADDPRGGVDVADTANNRIQALDPDGAVQAAWGLAGRGPGYVTRPRGVAFAPDGAIAVADTLDHRIERFAPDGGFGGQFGLISSFNGFATAGAAPGQFSSPEGVAVTADGVTWVADTGNDRLQALAAGGALVRTVALSRPVAVAAGPGDGVTVAARTGVVHVGSGGDVTPVATGLGRPAAVVVAGAHVYAADATRVAEDGAAVAPPPGSAAWDHPTGLAAALDGTLYVSEARPGTAGGARVLRRSGGDWDTIAGEGTGPAQVIEPAGLALSPDGGTLLVADAGNNRVLRFDDPAHAPPDPPPLTVAVDDITRGQVTSDDPGIACATDCVQHYGAGRLVTLTATPAGGSVFAGWSGACAGTAPACTVTIAGATAVGASFAPAPPPPLAPPPPAAAPPPPPALRILAVRISPRRLHLARGRRRATSARVTVTLSRPAALTAGVQAARPGRRSGSRCLVPTRRTRRRPACTRWVAVGSARTLHSPAFHLAPVAGRRLLRAGAYRLAVTVLDTNGSRVGPTTARFSVAR